MLKIKKLSLVMLLIFVLLWAGKKPALASGFTPELKISVPSAIVGNTVKLEGGIKEKNINTEGYKYKFVWGMNNWQKWGVIQSFSIKNTAQVTLKLPGTYSFYVDVMDKNGKVITASKVQNFSLGFNGAFTVPSSGTVGVPLTINATSKRNDLKYKFVWQMNNWSPWGVIKPYNKTSFVDFTPARPGTHYLYADVMDRFGNVDTGYKTINISLGWDSRFNSSVSKTTVGGTISANGAIVNPVAENPCTYKFVWSKNNWQEWGIISNFSSKNAVTFTPKNSGNYEIYMDVKDKYGNVVVKKSPVYTFVTDWKANTPTVNITSNKVGGNVNIKANPSKSLPGATYKFVWSYNNWQQWGIIQNFSTKNTVSFSPPRPGKIDIYTDIRDANGSVNTAYTSITIKGKRVALTFDDGPSKHTTSIVNTLNKYGVKGTFFMLGSNAGRYPDIVRKVYNSGHEIGNHSYSHKQLTKLSANSIRSEINSTQSVIYNITGKYPRYLRPPYGSVNSNVTRVISMPYVNWTIDTLDWKNRNANATYSRAISNLKDGDIILMHDIYPSTASAVEMIVPYLLRNGFYPVTISELKG